MWFPRLLCVRRPESPACASYYVSGSGYFESASYIATSAHDPMASALADGLNSRAALSFGGDKHAQHTRHARIADLVLAESATPSSPRTHRVTVRYEQSRFDGERAHVVTRASGAWPSAWPASARSSGVEWSVDQNEQWPAPRLGDAHARMGSSAVRGPPSTAYVA